MKLDFNVKVKDLAPGILRRLREEMKNVEMRVGFLDGVPGEQGQMGNTPVDGAPDIDLADLAAAHEFGATIQRGETSIVLLERSFLRAGMEANRSKLTQRLTDVLRAVVDGHLNPREGFTKLALQTASDVKNFVRENRIRPPDKQDTIDRKERRRAEGNADSSVTLIDTGQLVRGITGDAKVNGQGGSGGGPQSVV